MKIKVMLVDNQLVVRQGINALLSDQPDIEVAAEAADGAEALERISKVKPDVVVVEPTVPGFEGVKTIQRYQEAGGDTEILILTTEKNRKNVRDSLQAGAKGYVLKTASISEIITAIKTVHDKGYHLSPEISAEIINAFVKKQDTTAEANLYTRLSKREKQVFRLIAEGATTGEIAETLKISPKTVAKHRMSIMEKLLLKNTASLVHYAARIGVLDHSS
ncbi:MAG: response regulator transcription factor [Desulfobacteraceae bacterium]|nr:response regulator transcription factor [Desulfobacteraceae bacterium]MCF8093834.1 response regulator transcription factor [Desulfobacteraceae bacterium]